MRSLDPLVPDWRDAAAYAPLLEADRSLFAWEWLRRDPVYRLAADAAGSMTSASASASAAAFGLVRFEPAGLGVPAARPFWRSDAYPFVLSVEPGGSTNAADLFEAAVLGAMAVVAGDDRSSHLLITDGWRTIRLDAPAGLFGAGPRPLRFCLEGIEAAMSPLVTLRRLLSLCGTGRFSRSLHPPEPRARRWILMLRAYDGLAAGATQRELAQLLLSPSAGQPRWRVGQPSLRSRAQRLARSATEAAAGAYRDLLR